MQKRCSNIFRKNQLYVISEWILSKYWASENNDSNVQKSLWRGQCISLGSREKGTGQLIGTCGFHLINNHHKRAEIGYELDDTYWGQGYALEALQAILAYGFEILQLIRIAAVVYVENKASQKLLIKQDFKKKDYFENIWFKMELLMIPFYILY